MKRIHLLILFLFLEIGTLIILFANYKTKEDSILNAETQLAVSQYKIINDSFKNLANSVFFGYINKPQIIDAFDKRDREHLLSLLNEDYQYLKTIDFEQIHFHLPNNHSFLRLHRPGKYGDDLTNIRYSVEFVNKNKVKISGLEIGRVLPGFRYVYPLFKDFKYIGSVENSFGADAFIKRLEKIYNIQVHFLIEKELFDKKVFDVYKDLYQKSIEHDDYILLKPNKETFDEKTQNYLQNLYQTKLKNRVDLKVKQKKTFSLEVKINTKDGIKHKIVTFLQLKNIKNEKIGYFVIYKDNDKLEKVEEEFFEECLIFSFINFLILLLIYKEISKKETLEKTVKEKTAQLNLLNLSLEERIKREVIKSKKQEEKLHEYEKMEQMAELMGNIAHQWRQPLGAISVAASGLKIEDELNILKKEDIKFHVDSILKNTNFLSSTIDTFTEYIRNNSEVKEVLIQGVIVETLNIIKSTYKTCNINIIYERDECEDIYKEIVPNDLSQILIILLTNAKEALIKDDIQNPYIEISIKKQTNSFSIIVEDNAKGIDERIISKIFDPYFTTKHQAQGVGLGLHIARRVARNNLNAEVTVENSKAGVCAKVKIPY